MKQPSDVRQLLQRQFDRRHQDWLVGAGAWPLEVALGIPSEQFALGQLAATRAWVAEWQAWQDGALLQWTERRWRTLGTQRLPELLRFDGPAQVAAWLGMGERWERAILRRAQLADRWPMLAPRLGKHFSVLADYSDLDFERLVSVTGWLAAHPDCGLYLRQLPVPGVDTKWIEARKPLLGELISSVTGRVEADLYALCGLRRPPVLVRMRILEMRIVTLDVADRVAVEFDDERFDRNAVDMLVDPLQRRGRVVVPPFFDVRLRQPARQQRQISAGHRPKAVAKAGVRRFQWFRP